MLNKYRAKYVESMQWSGQLVTLLRKSASTQCWERHRGGWVLWTLLRWRVSRLPWFWVLTSPEFNRQEATRTRRSREGVSRYRKWRRRRGTEGESERAVTTWQKVNTRMNFVVRKGWKMINCHSAAVTAWKQCSGTFIIVKHPHLCCLPSIFTASLFPLSHEEEKQEW